MKKHARLSPSSAHRWMACAGAPRLEATVPEQPAGPHADLGTAAHAIAEEVLDANLPYEELQAFTFLYIEDQETGGRKKVIIGQDTRDAIWQYVTIIREKAAELQVEPTLERFVSLAPLNPPPGLEGGTVDCTMYDAANRHLYIYDYKNGYTPVDAEDNEQMRLYALGVVVEDRIKPETITTTIVQPRSRDEDVKPDEFTWAELVEFKKTAFAAARAANDPDAPVGPVGSHCKWCRAKAICPAQTALAQETVQAEFEALADTTPVPVSEVAGDKEKQAYLVEQTQKTHLPAPHDLTQERLLTVLDKAPLVEDWLKSVRDYAHALAEAGEDLPGWKLVDKRATRKWRDEEEAEAWLRQRFRVGDIFKKKLVSPYQAEKLVGREFQRVEVPEEFIVSESSGTNLVPEDHPKPAVKRLTAAEEFDVQS